jgi:beta-galactosidase
VWTGFDYLGEPTPYGGDLTGLQPGTRRYEQARELLDKQGVTEVPSRSSYFGIIDLAGFPKDRYYLYQSKWRPELPMAHILPHWNWPERKGMVTPVQVYTSATRRNSSLTVNRLAGRKKVTVIQLRWDDVVYQPGELRVSSIPERHQMGRRQYEVKTGKAARLSMSADRQQAKPDGTDLIFITVMVEDKNLLMVPRSNNHLIFSIEGTERLWLSITGDATSHEPFQASSRKAYNGMCLVIVKPGGIVG